VRLQLRALEAGVDATQRRDGTVNRFLFSLVVDRQAPANPARPDALGVRSLDVTVDALPPACEPASTSLLPRQSPRRGP
jgi:hypothetical protein